MPPLSPPLPPSPTAQESAEYTYDMLLALREMAAERGQECLATLLSTAMAEARSLASEPDAETAKLLSALTLL
jgi:hypothetical protein